MTKVNNYKNIRFLSWILIVAGFLVFLIFTLNASVFLLKITLIPVLATLLIVGFRIRCVEYEQSGECIMLKKFHPFNTCKRILPFMEFPKKYLKDYRIKKEFMACKVTLILESDHKRKLIRNIKFPVLRPDEISAITRSLENIKSYNDEEFRSN